MPQNASPTHDNSPLPRGSRVRYGDFVAKRRRMIGYHAAESAGYMPLFSIFAILIGTSLALTLVPENVMAPGSLRASGIAMALGLAAGPVASSFVNPRNFLRTENIIGIAPAYWIILDLITGTQEMPALLSGTAASTLVLVALATSAYWIGVMGQAWRLPAGFMRACTFRIDSNALLPVIIVCFTLAMLRFAIPCNFDLYLMFKSVFGARWNAPWVRGSLGGWDAFADHLVYFGYLLPTLTIITARRTGWLSFRTFVATGCTLLFLLFLMQSGSRRIIGVIFAAALIYWILDQRKIRIWQIFAAFAMVGLLIWFMQLMIIVRGVGLRQIGFGLAARLAYESIKGNETVAGAPSSIHVDDNFLRLAQTKSLVPDRFPFVYHEQLLHVLVRPIPRVLWPNKPKDPGFNLWEVFNTGASLTTTILGEFWISWGYPAVLFGAWIYGRLARVTSPFFTSEPGSMAPMFYGYITMTLFVGYRSMVEVILFSYAVGGWWFATWMIKRIRH